MAMYFVFAPRRHDVDETRVERFEGKRSASPVVPIREGNSRRKIPPGSGAVLADDELGEACRSEARELSTLCVYTWYIERK